jgi:hypothetical protein
VRVFARKSAALDPAATRGLANQTRCARGARKTIEAVLSALAALGCGLAAVQGDLLFVAIFGVARILTIIEAIRRLQ